MPESENKWYVLKVRPRHEKTIADRLASEYEIFLPLVKNTRKWSDRIKVIESPLISGYLFIKTDIKRKHYILAEQGVSCFVEFKKKPAVIRENEINALHVMTENPESLQIDDGYDYKQGDEVVINRGAFAGIKGRVKLLKNKCRLFVSIEQLGKIISVEVDKCNLESVSPKK